MEDVEVGAQTVSAPSTPQVVVLLATYNGERFLREQIDSLLAQDCPGLRILAGDDGSTDATPAILSGYQARFPGRFEVLPQQPPTGSAKANFLRLMRWVETGVEADFICFADQDDVWLPDKVSRSLAAIQRLEQRHGAATPLLVFSDLGVVDAQLRTIATSMWRFMKIDPASVQHLQRLVGRSVVTGCTMTINRTMLALAQRMSAAAPMHDRWIAMLAATMGASAIVPGQTVLYRQHGSNAIGATAPDATAGGIVRRATHDRGRRRERILSEKLAEALLELHEPDMPPSTAELLRAYLRSGQSENACVRLWLTLRHGFFRGGLLQNLLTIFDLSRSESGSPDD